AIARDPVDRLGLRDLQCPERPYGYMRIVGNRLATGENERAELNVSATGMMVFARKDERAIAIFYELAGTGDHSAQDCRTAVCDVEKRSSRPRNDEVVLDGRRLVAKEKGQSRGGGTV